MIVPPPPPPPVSPTNLHEYQTQQVNSQQHQVEAYETSPNTVSEPVVGARSTPAAADAAAADDNSCYLADDDATVDLGKPTAAAGEHQEVAHVKALAATTTKRRSSWRHLLSPSYKSRSDEFHKFFATEIPKSERLIADYSCALHRDLLIQGRLYVSVNYLAFYSNLFGWITKLVVRLRDIRDIYKANTVKFIPNAIQILTKADEKHVFASFIARDKSFLLIWRIWRNNNQLKERLSDQEMRKLVHLSYGKDLGLNDVEESEISAQPLPRTPANFIDELRNDQQQQQVLVLDRNNNTAGAPGKQRTAAAKRSRFKSRSQNQKELMLLMNSGGGGGGGDDAAQHKGRGHARYSSVDCGRVQPSVSVAPAPPSRQVDQMLNELSGKLAELSSTTTAAAAAHLAATNGPNELATCSPASSAVVVDTPASLKGRRSRESHDSPDAAITTTTTAAAEDNHVESGGGQIFASGALRAPNLAEAQQQVGSSEGTATNVDPTSEQLASTSIVECDGSTDQQQPAMRADEQQQVEPVANLVENSSSVEVVDEQQRAQQQQQQPQQQDLMGPPLNTSCECDAHDGEPIVDEQLDINVDILFSLIFTNSKFMRAHMMQRGLEDLVVGKWRRPAGQSDRSNSSTLSSRGGEGESGAGDHLSIRSRRGSTTSSQHRAQARKNFKTKQVRQLNYSMNVNHVLAKQVHVDERQNICQVRPGVYVLESQTVNSGFPCSESFTIDLKYCLTRTSHLNKSRLRVHGRINFLKEKQSWRLAMVKPIIEKQSMQGIIDFVTDLVVSVRKHIELKKQQADPTVYLSEADSIFHSNNISPNQSSAHQPPPPLAQQQVGSAKSHFRNHHHHQHSRASLARAKSRLKERKLRNMYKYYIQSRSHQGDDNDSSGADRGLGEPRSPGGATSSLVSSDSRSSSMSSLCCGGLDDDDESMIMMLASGGGRGKTTRQNHLSTNHRHHRRHRNHPDETTTTTDDDDDDETGDEYGVGTRANNHHLLVDRRSFSDLEDGPTQQQQQQQLFSGNLSDQDDEWPRRRRHRDSETSNATLNNEQPARAPIKRLFDGWIGGGGGSSRRRRSSAQSATVHNHLALHANKPARRTHGDRARPSAAATAQQFQTGNGADEQQQQQVTATAGRRLLSAQNLISLLLVCLVILVLFMFASHVVILRRLGRVEQLLAANCNSSHQQPRPYMIE